MHITNSGGTQTGRQELQYSPGCGKFYAGASAARSHARTPGHSAQPMELAVRLEMETGRPKATVIHPLTGREAT